MYRIYMHALNLFIVLCSYEPWSELMYERPQLNVGRVGGCSYVDSRPPHVMFDEEGIFGC